MENDEFPIAAPAKKQNGPISSGDAQGQGFLDKRRPVRVYLPAPQRQRHGRSTEAQLQWAGFQYRSGGDQAARVEG